MKYRVSIDFEVEASSPKEAVHNFVDQISAYGIYLAYTVENVETGEVDGVIAEELPDEIADKLGPA